MFSVFLWSAVYSEKKKQNKPEGVFFVFLNDSKSCTGILSMLIDWKYFPFKWFLLAVFYYCCFYPFLEQSASYNSRAMVLLWEPQEQMPFEMLAGWIYGKEKKKYFCTLNIFQKKTLILEVVFVNSKN